MPIVTSCCCGKASLKAGSIAIGVILLAFSVAFLAVSVGLVAGWDKIDTTFLDNERIKEKIANSTELAKLRETFQKEIRPVWKKEFVSLYCFLPWYALANVLLIIGAKKEIKTLLIQWILFTVAFLIWSFVLVSVMLTYDTTPGFVVVLALAQIFNFVLMAVFIMVVFSLYQDLTCRRVKAIGHNYDIHEDEADNRSES